MDIKFFGSFAKKDNSTKAPDVSNPTRTLTGYLIEPCSIMEPTFKIERFASDASPQSYTYAYISEFSRFYFVEDWVWSDGLWQCRLKEDVLASFKTAIGNSTEYILRHDSSADFNSNITDTTYPATSNIDYIEVPGSNPFSPATLSAGCFIVGIISGDDTNAVGAISYFIMTSTQFGRLKDILFSNSNLQTMGIIDSQGQQLVQDLSQEVLKTLYNPYQYIASCMWFPIDISDIVDKQSVSIIKIGWWNYNINCYALTYPMMNLTETGISIPTHPQSLRGRYLNYAPYTKLSLRGRYGTIPLDTAWFAPGDSVYVRYNVDLVTGKCRAIIQRDRGGAISALTERSFEVGTPIQIAQIGYDYLGVAATSISSGATAMQQLFTGNIGGAIATTANGIYNTIQSQMPQLETSGTNGSFLSSNMFTFLCVLFYHIVDEDIHHRGRPLCELRQISTLSGYVLCADGELDLNCFDNERKEILRYLTTGFYWE